MVKITNNIRILLKLRELDVEITNKDLAELTDIPEKNISRYLKYLEQRGLIERRFESKHQLRQCFNSISQKGREFDESTYNPKTNVESLKTIESKTIDEKNGLKTLGNIEILPPFFKLGNNFDIGDILLDEFQQLRTYFRKGVRPSQKVAIENFEKHLKDLKRFI